MKNIFKFILPCLIIFILVGCDLNNTPTSKVEEKLSNYQMLDSSIDVNEKISFFANGDNLTDVQIEKYRKIIEKQYKTMSYNIKNETIDGDSAVVEVQIEVLDYTTVIERLDNDIEKYHNDRINKLNDVKDKITYTIEFSVTKNVDGDWKLDDLSSVYEQKILGIY